MIKYTQDIDALRCSHFCTSAQGSIKQDLFIEFL